MANHSRPVAGSQPHDSDHPDDDDMDDGSISEESDTSLDNQEPGPSRKPEKKVRNKVPKLIQMGDTDYFECQECEMICKGRDGGRRHAQTHLTPKYTCSKCGKQSRRPHRHQEHEANCTGPKKPKRHSCFPCEKAFRDAHALKRHCETNSHKRVVEELEPGRNGAQIKRNQTAQKRRPAEEGLHPMFENEDPMDPKVPKRARKAMKDELRRKWSYIHTWNDRRRSCCQLFNIRLRDNFKFKDVMKEITRLQGPIPFKVVVEGGFMIERKSTTEDEETGENREEWEYRYLYPSTNTTMVNMQTVYDEASLQKVIDEFKEGNTLETAMNISPDSRWQFRDIVNVMIRIHPQPRFRRLGYLDEELEQADPAIVTVEDQMIERHLRLSRCIKSLSRDESRIPYTDHLCVFRVIADIMKEKGLREGSMSHIAVDLYNEWCAYKYDHPVPIRQYLGTPEEHLVQIETFFDLKINVFELRVEGMGPPKRRRKRRRVPSDSDDEDLQDAGDLMQEIEADNRGGDNVAELLADAELQEEGAVEVDMGRAAPEPPQPEEKRVEAYLLRRSLRTTGTEVNALIFRDHFYRVTDPKVLCRTWRCERCNRMFDRFSSCDRHKRTCTAEMKRVYPDGGFTLPKTVWQRLREMGFETEDQYYKYRLVFDFEARFESLPTSHPDAKRKLLKKLIPLSVAIKSNFDGGPGTFFNRPVFFCEEDPNELLKQFHGYLLDTAKVIGETVKSELIAEYTFAQGQAKRYRELVKELKEMGGCEEESLKAQILNEMAIEKEKAKTFAALKRWIHQVPTIGFNSGKFDINLVREFLLPCLLNERNDPISTIIQRGNDFLSINTKHLAFLDMIHYLPPGVNLERFIECYGPPGTQNKLKWMYEYIDRFSRLEEGFPDDNPEVFWSTLRNEGISMEDFLMMKQLYYESRCRNLRDLLEIYNIRDVEPFDAAIGNMAEIFKDVFSVDIFKGCVSLPGVAMKRMFSRQGDTIVPLFSEKYKDWHNTIKENVVGGPAMIFMRQMEIGDCLHPMMDCKAQRLVNNGHCACNSKKCQKILGFDANSLYLYCTGCSMPVGIPREYTPVVEEAHDVPVSADAGVSKEACLKMIQENMDKRFNYRYTYHSAYEVPWILSEYRRLQDEENAAAEQEGRESRTFSVNHAYNGGQKLFLTADKKNRIYVDGYIPELNLAMEYLGCYYHGHDCAAHEARVNRHPDPVARAREEYFRKERYDQTQARLQELRDQDVQVEATWECEARQRANPRFEAAIAEVLPKEPRRYPTAGSIVEQIKDGSMFGLAEVDLQVPWWDEELRQYMAEFPPIFKNTSIGREDVGEYMKNFAIDHKLLSKPRRSLISSYHGKKLCMITPLLQYLLSKGVVITRVYKAIEFAKDRSYQFITDEVTRFRKEADESADDRQAAAKGNVAKLVGNSCYGKCLTNIEKHLTVKLMNQNEASDAINDPLFTKMDPVDDENYLISFSKGRVVHNLPTIVAFFVYNYAKMVMLQFYYDMLLKHLGKENFTMLEMDTDSMYFACSESTLDQAAKDSPTFQVDKPMYIESPETKRQPGLFKLEWSGEKFIGLNPKCYYGFSTGDKCKISMKGVSHKTNSFTYDDYKRVLTDTNCDIVTGINKGFVKNGTSLAQYELTKVALTHLYIKRIVMPDRVSTMPLAL